MKLAPSPLTPRTVLFHQPLARAVDLQPGRVDHDVSRPARLGSCQRRRERQARTAPGFVAARLIGFVGHWSPARRGDGPIRPTVVLPKPKAAILHQRPAGSLLPAPSPPGLI